MNNIFIHNIFIHNIYFIRPMFSLCIPTMDRFDNFLIQYLPKYLEMDLINEIVISDENGNDAAKIREAFPDNPKLRIFVNESCLGPLLNKVRVCSHASNEWIALIDSDNFADQDYFIAAKDYLDKHISVDQKNIILAPCRGNPDFNWTHLTGFIYKMGSFVENRRIEEQIRLYPSAGHSSTLMNTGNYIINKYLIDNIDFSKDPNIPKTDPCDVIYFNKTLFEKLDMNLHVVPNMEYTHSIHPDSIYSKKHMQFWDFIVHVHDEFHNLP